MNTKLEKVVDEMVALNLTLDITEEQIVDQIYEIDPFAWTFSKACPSSYLICC